MTEQLTNAIDLAGIEEVNFMRGVLMAAASLATEKSEWEPLALYSGLVAALDYPAAGDTFPEPLLEAVRIGARAVDETIVDLRRGRRPLSAALARELRAAKVHLAGRVT